MHLDHELFFSAAQAVTVSAPGQNILDIGQDNGGGTPLWIRCFVDGEDFAGSGTLAVSLQSDSDSDFGSAQTHFSSDPVPLAELVDGRRINLPPLPAEHERYLRLYYEIVDGPMTAGKITACLTLDDQSES